ncbi:MAG: hypothetical protein ACLQEQ_03740 [Nitrososphaerales archaeon]
MVKSDTSFIEEFRRSGLLLESDPDLPSVAGIVAGERVKGSWWGHPKGREIWHALRQLDVRTDVQVTRLVSGKVTFIHRRLWPDFLAISVSKESWQTKRLSTDAKKLLRTVEEEGTVRTDIRPPSLRLDGKVGDATRELERRLLVHGDEVHTETGSHAKIISAWSTWSASMNLRPNLSEAGAAKARFEALLDSLNRDYGGNGRLPWVK